MRSGSAAPVVAVQSLIVALGIEVVHSELVDLARREIAGGIADLPLKHPEAADQRLVGSAAGVRLAAQSGGDALIAGDEFGQVLADQLADVRRSRRCGVDRKSVV